MLEFNAAIAYCASAYICCCNASSIMAWSLLLDAVLGTKVYVYIRSIAQLPTVNQYVQ